MSLQRTRCLFQDLESVPGLTAGIISSTVLGALSMLAKETGITVIAIITMYDLYVHSNLVKR